MPANTTAYHEGTQAAVDEHIHVCERATQNSRHSIFAVPTVAKGGVSLGLL